MRSQLSLLHRTSVLCAALAVSLALLPSAWAGSAVDQYIEDIPASDGGSQSEPQGDGAASSPSPSEQPSLPPDRAQKVEQEGGASADSLKKVATSPELGAPRTPLALGQAGEERSGDEGGWSARTTGLLLFLILVPLALAATVLGRKHRARGS